MTAGQVHQLTWMRRCMALCDDPDLPPLTDAERALEDHKRAQEVARYEARMAAAFNLN